MMQPRQPDSVKHREIGFRDPHPDPQQAHSAAQALTCVEGIVSASVPSPARNILHVSYDLSLIGEIAERPPKLDIKVVAPVTSLCPCSKKISDYGAHNQRSHVTVSAETQGFVWIEDLIDLVENEASCELYGLLKRPDEKYVTEKAYNNPKFVEDIVRDIAKKLEKDNNITWYSVSAENFESIHNHSAYAHITSH